MLGWYYYGILLASDSGEERTSIVKLVTVEEAQLPEKVNPEASIFFQKRTTYFINWAKRIALGFVLLSSANYPFLDQSK